jgi:hypothetical protein
VVTFDNETKGRLGFFLQADDHDTHGPLVVQGVQEGSWASKAVRKGSETQKQRVATVADSVLCLAGQC